MSKPLQQILGGANMTGVIQSVKSGLPNLLPAGFTTPTRKVVGNTARYRKVDGNRELARLVQYGAPAALVGRRGVTETAVSLLHSFESIQHDPLVLQNLTRLDSEELQALAVDEIDRQSMEFKRRFENLRLCAIYSALSDGKLWFDAGGNLLFTSAGAAVTVDYGVPAGNRDQLGGIIGASWGVAGTDLIGDVQAIKKAALQTTGYPLAHAFYGANVPGYLANNTAAKAYITGTPALATQSYTSGEIPAGFAGLKWHPVYAAFGVDGAGTVTEFFGADTVVFTPEPSPDWWELIEGSYLVPTSIGKISEDPASSAASLSMQFGMFSYAKVTDNPVTVEHFAGDTFLPVLKVPAAVYIADVTP